MHSLSRKAGEVIQLEFHWNDTGCQLVVPLPRKDYIVAHVYVFKKIPLFHPCNIQPACNQIETGCRICLRLRLRFGAGFLWSLRYQAVMMTGEQSGLCFAAIK